ncbi:hypothetical protein [uncultured Cohaesibacter sp.]|uniref:hypothetical protein n=1 Tax=uncultured Cohaesibacter sp. TaxID=1002546 RepID=UPI0029C8E681|nr:hypothetical protein [uncultured Cohaesibacter sp.]
MAEVGVYDEDMIDLARRRSICKRLFLRFDFDDGNQVRRYNYGPGTRIIDGVKWQGFTGPDQLSLVNIESVTDTSVDAPTAVEITLNALDAAFLKSIRQNIDVVYGASAELFKQYYDVNSYQPVGPFKSLFQGFCGKPGFRRTAKGLCTMTLTIDSFLLARNFPPGGRVNDAWQKRLFTGDRGCELVGSPSNEFYR